MYSYEVFNLKKLNKDPFVHYILLQQKYFSKWDLNIELYDFKVGDAALFVEDPFELKFHRAVIKEISGMRFTIKVDDQTLIVSELSLLPDVGVSDKEFLETFSDDE